MKTYTVQQVAEMMEVNQNSVTRWIKRGRLAADKVKGRWVIRETALAKMLETTKVQPSAVPKLEMKGECSICAVPIPLQRDTCSCCTWGGTNEGNP